MFTDAELYFVSRLLELAGQSLSNKTCDDMPPEMMHIFSPSEWDVLDRDLNRINRSPEEHEPGSPCFQDWCWMHYLSGRIDENLQKKYDCDASHLLESFGGSDEILKRRALAKLGDDERRVLGLIDPEG